MVFSDNSYDREDLSNIYLYENNSAEVDSHWHCANTNYYCRVFDKDRLKVWAYFSDQKASFEVKTGGKISLSLVHLRNTCQSKKKENLGFEWPCQKICSKLENLWKYIRKFEHLSL